METTSSNLHDEIDVLPTAISLIALAHNRGWEVTYTITHGTQVLRATSPELIDKLTHIDVMWLDGAFDKGTVYFERTSRHRMIRSVGDARQIIATWELAPLGADRRKP